MRLPNLSFPERTRTAISEFYGYNHNLRIPEGSFYDCENLTTDCFPVLAPRKKRGVYRSGVKVSGMVDKGNIAYTEGSSIVIGGNVIEMGLSEGAKHLVSMGAYVVVFPDRKYINTSDFSDFGSIDASFTSEWGDGVTFSLCRLSGETYDQIYVSAEEPSEVNNLDLWMDTSSDPQVLKQWSATSETWVNVSTTYIRIGARGIGKSFNVGDGVKLSNVARPELSELNGSVVIQDKGDDYITVIGVMAEATYQQEQITVERKAPLMDFVFECENRLWGCRYGIASNGEFVNEIYCSKQGDFKNWEVFSGVSTDSYAVTVGTDGAFTGAVSYQGSPYFFKENCYHKISGYSPSTYQMMGNFCPGVMRGAEKSFAIVGGVLFYQAPDGVYAFDGSFPTKVSGAFGNERYKGGIGASAFGKYYIALEKVETGAHWELPVYASGKLHLTQVGFVEVAEGIATLDGWEEPTLEDGILYFPGICCKIEEQVFNVPYFDRESQYFSPEPEKTLGLTIITGKFETRSFIFVYDPVRGIWQKENGKASQLCTSGGEVYYYDENEGCIAMIGHSDGDEREVCWIAETSMIDVMTPERTYVCGVSVSTVINEGARLLISVEYNSSGHWIPVASVGGNGAKSGSYDVQIRRCDHFRLKLEGQGDCKVLALHKITQKGSTRR